MSSAWNKQTASRLGRAIVTTLVTANATQSTTAFGSQVRQVRVTSSLPAWITIGSTATDVTAGSSSSYLPANTPEYFTVSPGQHVNFLSSSTSTGYLSVTEML